MHLGYTGASFFFFYLKPLFASMSRLSAPLARRRSHTQKWRAFKFRIFFFFAHRIGNSAGTMVCGDPERRAALVLLTNRVYPDEHNTRIGAVRRAVGRAVQEALDAAQGPRPIAVCK